MLEIEIQIVRPIKILLIIGGTIGLVLLAQSFVDAQEPIAGGVGGPMLNQQHQVYMAEDELYKRRIEQAVLERREEILRYQLRQLEQLGAEGAEGVAGVSAQLKELIMDRRKSEEHIHIALRQMWEAQGRASIVSKRAGVLKKLSWPVEPRHGISAYFLDEEYREIFGIPHQAIDIPIEQKSIIRAAADGVVTDVVDNHEGYNYIILQHDGGSTLYGHITSSLVREGQFVRRGNAVARSGGMPGTRGAGSLSTGPHLHFEVIRGGVHVDPLRYLSSNQ